MASTLQELRKASGYKSARDFAEAADIPANTYARYESRPETIPYERASQIADLLRCTLDEVYGREAPDTSDKRGDFQKLYDDLSDDGKTLLDQFAAIIRARDNMARRRRRSEEDRKFEDYARYYEKLLTQKAQDDPDLADVVIFGSDYQKYYALWNLINDRAIENRKKKLELARSGWDIDLSIKYGFLGYDENGHLGGTGKVDPEAKDKLCQEMDEIEKKTLDAWRREDADTREAIMDAYDRLHGLVKGEKPNYPSFVWDYGPDEPGYTGQSLFIGFDSSGNRIDEGGDADN